MSLRWRLTLTYAALLALLLLAAGSLNYLAVRQTLYIGLDDALRVFAQKEASMAARAEPEPATRVDASLNAINRQQPIRMTIYDAQEREVDWGPSRVGFVPTAGSSQIGSERVYVLKTARGWIQTTQSDQEARAALTRILHSELLMVPLLLLVALGVGYLLADRALQPVDQVSDLAARIARSGQPGERVPQAPGTDELARLTRTINEMLAKLDAQLTRERLFAHASAHELRTPISVIRAAASLALEQERSPGGYRDALAQIHDVSEDMSALTHRLMELAQATRGAEARPVNLADVTLMASEVHASAAHLKNMPLEVTITDVSTSGDFNALVLAAGNLIQNAIKYGPPGSPIRVSCETDGVHARLTVHDAGPGLQEADVPRLVQPFQRGRQLHNAGGAGLGLALVQAIMNAHGGHLALTNHAAGGLRADLILPAAGQQAEA